MSIVDSIRKQFTPITPEGYPFIGAFELVALVLFWVWAPLGWFGTVLALWCIYFFRDPPRVAPLRDAAAAHLDLHERVQLPREPLAGVRPRREDRLHAGQVLQCRSGQGERA